MQYSIQESVGFQINITAQNMRNRFARHIRPFDLTPEQYAALSLIVESPGVTLSEIAKSMLKDKTTISRLVDALEAKGFTKRVCDSEDRRVHRLESSSAGERVIEAAQKTVEPIKEQVESELSSQEKEQLFSLLARVQKIEF